MHTLIARLHTRLSEDRGASLVEYVLLTALIATVCLIAIQFLGLAAEESLDSSGSSLFVR